MNIIGAMIFVNTLMGRPDKTDSMGADCMNVSERVCEPNPQKRNQISSCGYFASRSKAPKQGPQQG